MRLLLEFLSLSNNVFFLYVLAIPQIDKGNQALLILMIFHYYFSNIFLIPFL